MSLGGGGGGDDGASWAMVSQLQQQANEARQEAARVKAQNDQAAALEETKRVERVKSGGLSAFTTNGFMGYSDKTLGGGGSVSVTV